MGIMEQTVVVFALIGFIHCQSLNDLDFSGDLKGGLKDLNINVQDFETNVTNLPGAPEVEKVMRDKCAKKGSPEVVDLLKDEQNNAKLCVESFVNMTAIQEQLEEAKKTGSMDEVFAKYCKLWPEIHACFDNATELARQCMEEKEEKSFNKTLEILQELKEFSCFKDGDRLAMFVAEGGIECVGERQEGVQNCINKTLGNRFPNDGEITAANLPMLLFSDEDCEDFDEIRECINTELEECSESTPANIVDAFLKFVKKQMPCGGAKLPPKVQASLSNENQSSCSGFFSSSLVLVVTSMIMRFY